jgi:polyisoprenoid-binding protein YceI
MRPIPIYLAAAILFPFTVRAQATKGVPVFEIAEAESTIKFNVKASVAIEGTFDKWNAKLTFRSRDVTTGVLDLKIQAGSVNTGNGMKNSRLKSEDFFDAERNPLIAFRSKRIVQTGPESFEAVGDFTIRGVTKPEKLKLTITGERTGLGDIKGAMAFDRKDYGMDKVIPFVKLADRVEVTVDLKVKQVSGPRLVYQGVDYLPSATRVTTAAKSGIKYKP